MAANQVTVATPGPAGVPGLTYEGLWVVGSVYQVRDCVRFTDGNLYVVNVQHTSANGNSPAQNVTPTGTYWTLFINANDAFQWATLGQYELIGDSLGNTGYSALHQAKQAEDWATLTTDAVRNDTNGADVEYSAKAWAIGGTEVTTTASRGASKEWAIADGRVDHPSTGGYSAKAWATGGTGVTTTAGHGAAKQWATTTGGQVDTAEYSAKEYAQGSVLAAGGSSKNWAQLATTPTTTATDASAKEWATGVSTHKNEGSSKDWAIYTAGDVRGAASGSMSSKEWAVGTQGRGVANEGSSKDWATRTAATVDNAEYSAKEYSQGSVLAAGGSAKNWAQLATTPTTTATDASAKEWATGVSTHKNEGSAKDWAVYTSGDVRGASAGSMSSKEWAVGIQGRGVASEGSSKDWATRTAATVDNAEYSAKEYATGTTVSTGSAKEWAQDTSAAVDTTFSAKEYAQGTQASTGGSAKSWSQDTDQVNGAGTNDRSAKAWSQGASMTGATLGGSSKDWASLAVSTGTVDGTLYSSKAYAQSATAGTSTYGGSAKGWASTAYGAAVPGAGSGDRSALHYSTDASNSAIAAKNSAAAVANTFDAFDDTYLGTMKDAFIFTASSSSGLLITDNDHGLLDGNIIQVASTTTLPTGLSASTNYYVRDKTDNTFRLATTSGGTAIAYTNAGSGVHSWVYGSPTTNGTWIKDSSSITVVSNVGIRVGQKVSGTGIPTSPIPNVLSIDGTTIVISENMAAAGSAVATTFSSLGINGPFSTTKDGPTTDNDGGALVNGMLYFNTTDNAMMIYKTVGAEWIAATASGGASLVMHKAVASGSETSFAANTFTPALVYEVNNIVVFLNGVRLDATDYTATTGTSITGLAALAASDELVVMAFKTFEVADAVSAASGGTFNGAVTCAAGLTANTADINGGTLGGITIDGNWTAASQTCADLGTVTTVDINGGTIDGATITGNITGNASGTAATVTGAAQSAITSVGTLTALTGGTGDLNWDSNTLVVDSSESKVGIGTAVPDASLEISISDDTDYTATNTSLDPAAFDQLHLTNTNADADISGMVFQNRTSSASFARIALVHQGNNDGDLIFAFRDPSNASNSVERMRITGGGDLETSTTGKIKQKGAFMQSSTHQAWVMGG